ncbi:MAG TPA: amino acid adenylation domain-containing protein [Thermoanaerobaculia bacterium]|nr:amino acid adenylation domain-containing protein [Thermoanaerobaculia bacterium]
MATGTRGFRLSPQQKHAWRLLQDSRAFRAQATVEIRGELDAPRLRAALSEVAGRHQSLHTRFRRSPGFKFPIQVPSETPADLAPAWREVDLAPSGGEPAAEMRAEAQGILDQAARRPFDVERGPLASAWLARTGAASHLLLLDLSILIADRASLEILVRDLAAAYERPGSGPPAEEMVAYIQFSEWQNELLESAESEAGREIWRRRDTAPAFRIAIPEAVPPKAGAAGGFAPAAVPLAVPDATAARLDALAAEIGIAPSDALLAAWCVLLARLSGRSRVGLGLGTGGRSHEDLAPVIGLFARTLPLVVEIDLGGPFRAAAARVAAAAAEAVDDQDYFSRDGETELAPFPAAFEHRGAPEPCRAGGLEISLLSASAPNERAFVTLATERRDSGLSGALRFDARALAAEAAGRLAERFVRLLSDLAARPDAALGGLGLLTPQEEREILIDANRTAAPFPDSTLHALFAATAAEHPEAIALEAGGRRLTYRELEARADRLAVRLRAAGAGRGSRVGLHLERSPEMVVALFAVLKAGGAYVPLDPATPGERLAFQMTDARLDLVLTEEPLAAQLPRVEGIEALVLAPEEAGADPLPAVAPPPDLAGPDDLAYVLYTSGSTGRPKGVMVPHRGLVNYLAWAVRAYDVASGSGAPVHSPLGFDLTVTSLLAPLLAGRTAVLLSEQRGVEELAGLLRTAGDLSLIKLTPAHLGLLAGGLGQSDLAGRAGALVLGGEQLLGESLAGWRERAPGTRLINEYGPTETVVGCITYELPRPEPGAPAPSGPVPIGKPIANVEAYLLDAQGIPVPAGVPGEILIGGAGLARGYLGRPDATAERFVPHPFSALPGARLYRTGDLARRLASGDLEFLGRNDHQVKIRGFRLELGEVEAAVAAHPAIRECAVLAREDAPGDRRLVAYLVLEPAAPAAGSPAAGISEPSVDELRRFLAARLPDAMVPSAFLTLHALPLTPNGKVDRSALPAPGSARPQLEEEYEAPRTPLEETLAEIWAEVLGLEKVGVHDSFFALGGDSIRSVQVIAALVERGIEATVEQMFRYQTVEAFARNLTPPAEATGRDLAEIVESLEGMSDEEAAALLREHLETAEVPGAEGGR